MLERMEIRPIADNGDLCTEGPVWNAREQALYWTDLARPRLYRYDWAAQSHERVSDQVQVSGYAFNDPDGLLVTNTLGIWLWDVACAPKLLAAEVDGRRCCMNDC